MTYSFRGMVPVVHPSAFVHPQATLIGHVTVGEDCYVGPHAVLRGDWGTIVLKCFTCFREQRFFSKKAPTLDTVPWCMVRTLVKIVWSA